MRLLLLTSQVSAYHNARYVASTEYFEDVHVVSTLNVGHFPEFVTDSVGKYTLHRLFNGRDAYSLAVERGEFAWQLRRVLESVSPTVVAAAGWIAPESLEALEFARERDVPIVLMSESQADDASRSLFREWVKRRIVSNFDAALVGGPPHAEYAANLGIPSDQIELGYNAVDNAYFARGARLARESDPEVRQDLSLPQKYILASARFIEKKNIVRLIHGYANARVQISEAPDLVILGDGPERNSIEKAIAAHGIGSNVHLLGFRGYATLPALYGLSEGFVHVSTSEQWGLVINEAMASGLPVVVSECCGAARTVVTHTSDGFITATDTEAIQDALLALFALSTEERTAMGVRAANTISDWGPERFGVGLRAAVDAAISKKRRGRIKAFDLTLMNYLKRKIVTTVS